MNKFQLTNEALEDLSEIWNYTFDNWSENQADKYYDLIINTCKLLAKNPKIGKSYEIIVSGLLGFVCDKHIIFYRISNSKEITIIRILHVSMDLENQLNG